ncbi:CAP isoform L [Danaus plexippus plexippus]|uniref:CAP isoform L n=1 Tax=Danaus plexippus plexippus TaxID=278856 RepID=A0A212FKT1_DANPL|nr:CAP isoform L [Danaus plexippus plexippus]
MSLFQKRPSQLIDGAEKATPHPPVYATIKQPNSPNKLPAKSPSNKSVQLVKSFEDTQNFHPTNPFYSTLPNTKLQITNGKSNSLHRSVNRTNYDDLKMSSFFKKNDPGAGSPNAGYQTSETSPRRFSFDKFSYDVKDSNNEDQIKKNPFNNGTNDFNPTDKLDGSPNGASMIYSKSDSNFRRNEFTEYTERKSVTEEMISETEEIKTIKKITLNGSSESDKPNGVHKLDSDRNNKERIVPVTLYDEGIKVNENRRNVGENTPREEYKEATETEDSLDSGCEKTVGPRTKYNDSKRTINKVSEKILKAIERLTCNIGKVSKVKKSEKIKKVRSSRLPLSDSPRRTVRTSPLKNKVHGPRLQCSGSSTSTNENLKEATENINQINVDLDEPNSKDKSLNNLEISNAGHEAKNEGFEESLKSSDMETGLSEKYIVETPDQNSKSIPKLNNAKKSKSCDDDDSPKIIEITDDSSQIDDISLSLVDSNNVIVTTEDPEVEWEKAELLNLPQTEIIKGILSESHNISLNTAQCEQTKSLSPEEELSLRHYLQTLNLSTNPNVNNADIKSEIEHIINREIKYRLRRKGLAEESFFERSGPSRSLAVIDEEGSGDSSKTSRRHSYLSDKKSDTEELEDEVFESKDSQIKRRRDTNFPHQSNLVSRHVIPQQCIKVDAKIMEPELCEARGDWKMETIEKITGAELVYLTDSSSSTSSIYEMSDDADKGHETDVSVRMITPTIEVTDTESLLKNTFLSKGTENKYKNVIDSDNNITNVEERNVHQDSNLIMGKEDIIDTEKSKIDIHEIIVLSTDDIKTDLFVKDINVNEKSTDALELNKKNSNEIDKYDLEIKVLKCELNDAINNLIKEVSDSENASDINMSDSKELFTRQDSSSSLDSSQCTAKYNPTSSSLNDVSSFLCNESQEEIKEEKIVRKTLSHVKDVIQHVDQKLVPDIEADFVTEKPSTLRDICLKRISSFPFGEKVLEELANVSKRLQDISKLSTNNKNINIQDINCQFHIKDDVLSQQKQLHNKENKHAPPPVQPRKSSLKKAKEEQSVSIPPLPEKVYECLSPSQKMLMEKTNTVINRDDIIAPSKPKFEQTERSRIDRKRESDPCVVPMKSETGSRLLALLRNTSSPKKLSLPTLIDDTYFQNPKPSSPRTDSFSVRMLQELDASNNFKETINNQKYMSSIPPINFKPIPPPKPRKIYTYESDSEFLSDSSFRSMRSDKKVFHYSTGNLNEEIENDISSIQNMHRQCTNLRNKNSNIVYPRRPSLPKDLCDQQMEYIRQKEKEVDAEIKRLEQEQLKSSQRRGPRAPMISEKDNNYSGLFETEKSFKKERISNHPNSKNVENRKLHSFFSSSEEELLREKMYTEYINQMAEREQRKHHRVIKVSQTPSSSNLISKSMPSLNYLDSKVNNRIEQEFISKAKERWNKLGIRDPETEDEREPRDVYKEPKVIEHKIRVIEDGQEKDVRKLPSHMQEFVRFTVRDKDKDENTGSTVYNYSPDDRQLLALGHVITTLSERGC